jgi:hypothetical protein
MLQDHFRRFVLPALLLGVAASAHAGKFAEQTESGPFFFAAGLCAVGPDSGFIEPPQCESFYLAGGD